MSQVFTSFSAETPQLFLDVDRDRAIRLGLSLAEIYNTLQTTLAGTYVNDFNLFGRSWQVKVEGEAQDRSQTQDILDVKVRSDTGAMIPVRAFAEVRETLGPQTIQRFNNFRAVTIQGSAAEGYSSGDAIDAMTDLAGQNLPQGYAYEWSGTALQELQSAGANADHPGTRRRVRLSLPRRALRELDDSDSGPSLDDGGDQRLARRRLADGVAEQPLRGRSASSSSSRSPPRTRS